MLIKNINRIQLLISFDARKNDFTNVKQNTIQFTLNTSHNRIIGYTNVSVVNKNVLPLGIRRFSTSIPQSASSNSPQNNLTRFPPLVSTSASTNNELLFKFVF